MNRNLPVDQLTSGHRPSELIPPGIHPGNVTIVLTSERPGQRFIGLTVFAVTVFTGVIVTIYMIGEVVHAVIAAVPSIGGLTLALTKGRRK